MEITKFDLKDKNELLELDRECFGIDIWDDDLWKEILEDLEHNIIYLVKQNNEIIAYLMIYNWGKEKNYVKITNIGTKSCFRGQKLAHKLLETMINEMKKEGMKDFRAETRITNYPMQKVFSDFNFINVETYKGYYDNPTEDAFIYHLNI
ncbi:Ribosomal protein S18 acetylase RimI [Clostridium acidisoli DSM 12555]|uniref:Ribosomal protein S18 acetylase RimI n=1 Tax=Clostridium acidisoli DSM 12555 TaxID=1121291 RepID=A0A1W1WY17_9CLOT|nr:N-acetyltransferase [Clostridium acidisoli]SMC16544.1 Ribosomal protein S18 acetylase RimI [Clostridium acidisoli DSM 12555]